jgi:cytochrome c553
MFSESVKGTDNTLALAGSNTVLKFPSLDTLIAPNRLNTATRPTPQETLNVAFELQDPARISSKDRTNFVGACASCHVAEGAVGLAKLEHGVSSTLLPKELVGLDTSYVRENTALNNLHAFGYLGRSVSIMQRTANESALVATAMQKTL